MENHKWKVMESEMDRFEAEISSLGSSGGGNGNPPPPGSMTMARPSGPGGLFIPASVVRRTATSIPAARPAVSAGPVIISGAPQVYKAGPVLSKGPSEAGTSSSYSATISAPPTSIQVQMPRHVRPSLIPGAPKITTAVGTTPRIVPINSTSDTVSLNDIKPKIELSLGSHDLQKPSTSTDAIPGTSSTKGKKKKKKGGEDTAASAEKKPRKHVRSAGGTVWEDPTLLDWDPSDFRLFCGDLGNDVTDEVLARVFARYPSFQKAKVVRDKRTNKTRGYGFVSFKDANDFIRAIRELDGRYVGSRPIKLRKSNWKNRSLNQVRKREKESKQLMGPKKAKL